MGVDIPNTFSILFAVAMVCGVVLFAESTILAYTLKPRRSKRALFSLLSGLSAVALAVWSAFYAFGPPLAGATRISPQLFQFYHHYYYINIALVFLLIVLTIANTFWLISALNQNNDLRSGRADSLAS